MPPHPTVSQEQWLQARKSLLAQEKENTRQRDALAQARRDLPWVQLTKPYTFDAPQGKVSLPDLFGPHSQLLVYHFMFGPDWHEGCPSCSYVSDHLNPALPHLAARDTSLVMVSLAPLAKIAPFKKRLGWQFPWVSAHDNSFNHDFHVYFTPQEMAQGQVPYNYTTQPFPSPEAPGLSVFYKDPKTNDIFHTYSTYGRGLDALLTTYTLLDLTPKGRDEDHLPFDMQWVRHHDRYDHPTTPFADPDLPFWPQTASLQPSPACCHAQEHK